MTPVPPIPASSSPFGHRDVESVEIYPMGFTTRPGYASHAHGLILVFLLGAK